MTISPEAKDMMKLFTMLQRLDILPRDEEFNMYYVWTKLVEEYAEKHKSERVQ